jgi:large subunit ribosomal protein LP1
VTSLESPRPGLTTGLGWSDSEDEDAPSPLTRRLSTLNLANRTSSSSLRSSVHPLSRSQSYSTLHEEDHYESVTPRRPIPRARPPPTSWQKRSGNGVGGGGRTSTSSVGSAFSLTLSIPEDEYEDTRPTGAHQTPSESSARHGGLPSSKSVRDAADTPSTSSTISLPMPVTPDDAPAHLKLDKEKFLPPLPPPAIRKYPSSLALRSPAARNIVSRPRALSNTSSASSSGAVTGSSTPSASVKSPPSASYTPRAATTPRPLRLSDSLTSRPQPGEVPQRSGQVLTYNRNLHDQQRMRAASGPSRPIISSSSTVPTTPTTSGFLKPMPRTGTGMVYRTSSNPGKAPPSRMRMPGAISQSLNVPSTPTRTTATPRSIAL